MTPMIARHHGLDWLRVGAFFLLILYHAGMVFVPWGWHIDALVMPDWVTVPMLLLNPWRLALLFTVSGFASRALLVKLGGPAAFARARTTRLILPLLFGVVVIVPPQFWVELRESHRYFGGYMHFWLDDWFRLGKEDGRWIPPLNHLWFVLYLWVYSMVLAGVLALMPAGAGRAAQRLFDRAVGGWRMVVAPLCWLALPRFILLPGRMETHDLVNDLPGHLFYLPAFLMGFGLAGSEAAWAGVRRWWPAALALAILGYAMMTAVEVRWPGNAVAPPEWQPLFRVGRWLMEWTPILALLGIADRWWNVDSRWRATLAEAVFPFYILHQTVVVVVAWWLKPLALPIGSFFSILVIATTAACWAFYLGLREVDWLRPFIGLGRRGPAPA